MTKIIPEISGALRKQMLRVPDVIRQASGIRIMGKLIRSLVFSTDVAIIRNINADAVIAVYPFTPQPIITHSIIMAADIPVLCGVGGGLTSGRRVVDLAQDAEFQGALGVVVNAPTPNETIAALKEVIDIPIVVTVVSDNENYDFRSRIEAGADILNVSGAGRTSEIVRKIRKDLPDVAILATGGPNEESILRTIEAGANAVTYTPPTNAELFRVRMEVYRDKLDANNK
ncbi:MAG: hydrolase [Christensenellales bacterium]|jgi:hypothetical protein